MTPNVAKALQVVAARRRSRASWPRRLRRPDGRKGHRGAEGRAAARASPRAARRPTRSPAPSRRCARGCAASLPRRAPLLDTCGPGRARPRPLQPLDGGRDRGGGRRRRRRQAWQPLDLLAGGLGGRARRRPASRSISTRKPRAGSSTTSASSSFSRPRFHPAMKELGTVRRELGVRTIFNALGPLANPAGASRQMIGVGRPELVRLLAEALAALGAERAIVFHSDNGLDELVPGVAAAGIEVSDGWTRPWRLDPASLDQRPVALAELSGGDAASNAAMLERLLDGEPGRRREAVLLNARARSGRRGARRATSPTATSVARHGRGQGRRARGLRRSEEGGRVRRSPRAKADERRPRSRSSRTSGRASPGENTAPASPAGAPGRRRAFRRLAARARRPDRGRDQGALALGGRDPAGSRREDRDVRARLPARPRRGDLGRRRGGPLRRQARLAAAREGSFGPARAPEGLRPRASASSISRRRSAPTRCC